MLRFVIRKLFSKKWMVLALLAGNILLVSIACGTPMYTQSVFQRTLTKQLEARLTEENIYPGTASLTLTSPAESIDVLAQYEDTAQRLPQAFGVEAQHIVTHISTARSGGTVRLQRDDAQHLQLNLNVMSGIEEHISLVAGRMCSPQPDEEGIWEAIVSESVLIDTPLLLDDVIALPRLTDAQGNGVQVRIVGVFTNSAEDDVYWVKNPAFYGQSCFLHEEAFRTLFLYDGVLKAPLSATWYVLMDYTAIKARQAEHILAAAQACADTYNTAWLKSYSDTFSDIISAYLTASKKVSTTLWVLQVPIFMLLAAFIFMVSRQMMEAEQNEIAVIKSRGAGRGQIFALYLMQSLLISLLAYAAGLAMGMFLCQMLGASSAFLSFVRRSALPVEITGEVLCYAGAASLFSICTMVLPAIRYSKVGIVDHKRGKNRRSATPMWQKFGLDFILLGVSLYGLYSFGGQEASLAGRVQGGASLDPLLFLSSSLFMIGCGLLAVRLMPVLVWVIFRIFRRAWSPAMYASFLQVLRTKAGQGFIMVFLIMTIALGVFNAQAARTINQNEEDNLRYRAGADIVLQEKWDNASLSATAPAYIEPDFGRYEALEGAEAVAKVYVNDEVSVTVADGTLKDVTLMGIHTRDFGETAWFKPGLTDVHWYHYLNAMAQNSKAILVSRSFQTTYRCKIGDSLTYRNADGESLRGTIYGFVDYFPGFEPIAWEKGYDGVYQEVEKHLIVAHLQQVQSAWGVLPYQVWINNRDSSAYLYDFAQENGLTFLSFEDAGAQLTEKKNDPILQGTNGILTVGFMVVLLLCSVGFLIYWIMSIKARSLQFGIFRAMGMSIREVLTMLLNEQLFISGLSIAAGALVGQLTSRLFMPLIQLGYAASDYLLPLEVVNLPTDQAQLFAVVGAMMLLCMIILGTLIARMKVTQALKLGED